MVKSLLLLVVSLKLIDPIKDLLYCFPVKPVLNLLASFYKQDYNSHNCSSLVVVYILCGMGITFFVLWRKFLHMW